MAQKKLKELMIAADGSRYRLVVFRVQDTYDYKKVGDAEVPAECLFVDDDQVVEISGGERFFTAYVPESVFGKAPPPEGT